jgi:hypothetical protein
MRYFNGFQLMTLFAAGPFLITYTHGADFYAHHVLMWVLMAGYIIGFGTLTALVGDNLEK